MDSYKLYTSYNARSFSIKTKNQELKQTNGHCRICNKLAGNGYFVPIYRKDKKIKRKGSNNRLHKNNEFIRSMDNCIYLCKSCHNLIEYDDYTVDDLLKFKHTSNKEMIKKWNKSWCHIL